MFISSHLLDEIEKTCDVAAIIDRGRVIAQGPIDELVADGAGELVVECDDAERALALLAGEPTVRELRREHGGLRMKLRTPRAGGRDQRAPGRRRRGGDPARAGAPQPGGAIPGDDDATGGGGMRLNVTVARQMVWAELLRLRKKRGFMALVLAVVLAPAGDLDRLPGDRARLEPGAVRAGGRTAALRRRCSSLLGVFMGPVAAVLIGAEAGAGDLAAGVFRDNVLTGRSRLALVPGPDPGGARGDLRGDRARLRVRTGGHVRLRRRAADAEHVGDPGVGGVAGAGQRPGVRDRDRRGIADRLTAGHDHRADRLGARAEPAARAVRFARLAASRACWTACCCSSSPARPAARRAIPMPVAVAVVVAAAWLLVLPGLGAWRMQTRDA